MARADSAYYGRDVLGTAVRHGAWFSVTARMNPEVKAAIASIDEDAWTPIKYPQAIWDQVASGGSPTPSRRDRLHRVHGRPRHKQVTCRLVVRRVRRLQPLACDGTDQGELFATWRHHAFVTNSTLTRSTPTRPTATTPSSSRSSPSSRTAPWPTCPRAVRRERRLGRLRRDRVQPRPRRGRRRRHGHRPQGHPAPPSSPSPPGSPPPPGGSCLHLPGRWPWATAWEALWEPPPDHRHR